MEDGIYAMLYLGDTSKIEAPFLSGASCTPCHTDRDRVESSEPRYTGDQVLKSLGGSETAIHGEQEGDTNLVRPGRKEFEGIEGMGGTMCFDLICEFHPV